MMVPSRMDCMFPIFCIIFKNGICSNIQDKLEIVVKNDISAVDKFFTTVKNKELIAIKNIKSSDNPIKYGIILLLSIIFLLFSFSLLLIFYS